jgi:predicted nucleic acid-binding protein
VILVDSSVWIDFFNGRSSSPADRLADLLADGSAPLSMADLVLFEVLRGFKHERDHREARILMQSLSIESTGGESLALAAAQHYRSLRAHGHTMGGAIDVLIASFCVENDYALLHRDADFDAFERLRGLRVWRH